METRMPLLVESSRLATDSGGAGRTRGGLSMQRALRVLAQQARYSLLSDGAVVPAFGVLGGLSGVPVGSWIDRDGVIEDFDTPGKVAGHPLDEGSIVMVRSAGGGGYGDPLDRGAERVASDVREGYVSAKAARELYGLELDKTGRVDAAATADARKRLRAGRFMLVTVLDTDAFEAGAVSRRRICRLNPADAAVAGIGEDDVVEMDTARAAPLRAWMRLDARVQPGTLPIDQRGLSILKAAAGERVELRRIAASVRPRVGFAEAAE
jgi:N-methylhydantoinase B